MQSHNKEITNQRNTLEILKKCKYDNSESLFKELDAFEEEWNSILKQLGNLYKELTHFQFIIC